MEILDEELDELRSDADLITPLPRPRPTPRPAAVAPAATFVPRTPLPPGMGLLGMTCGLPGTEGLLGGLLTLLSDLVVEVDGCRPRPLPLPTLGLLSSILDFACEFKTNACYVKK